MSSAGNWKRLRKVLLNNGFDLLRSDGPHEIWRDKNGRQTSIPASSPSDARAWANQCALLRRMGVDLGGLDGKSPKAKGVKAEAASTPAIPSPFSTSTETKVVRVERKQTVYLERDWIAQTLRATGLEIPDDVELEVSLEGEVIVIGWREVSEEITEAEGEPVGVGK